MTLKEALMSTEAKRRRREEPRDRRDEKSFLRATEIVDAPRMGHRPARLFGRF